MKRLQCLLTCMAMAMAMHAAAMAADCPVPTEAAISAQPAMRASLTDKWLSEHQAINKRMVGSPKAELVLVGDSLLARFRAEQLPQPLRQSALLNIAVGGDQTQNMLWRLEHLPLGSIEPREVVLLAGTNNLSHRLPACDVLAGIEKLVATLRQAWPRMHLTVVGILPRGKSLRVHEASRRLVNDGLAAAARRENFTFVDPTEAFLCNRSNDCGYYLDDMLHLTPTGYERLWSLLQPILQPALARPGPGK
ncbi:GDSL-type esterase/lipase family protein [uncultured Azohydromonas sp.]|jgi:Lysophospholipase L1 and related esterases|uniref:GDSL-type esterase/lipase family protein n=1 Tax=uncultured Azohydromonas sp. TaxID=487342 RepID=UPI002617FBAF|nr:GDSL-type esterase/lipase family protein [uncultured Azohydromonas sp.]